MSGPGPAPRSPPPVHPAPCWQVCQQAGDMAAFVGVIEHHAESCEAAQRIHEGEPLAGICAAAPATSKLNVAAERALHGQERQAGQPGTASSGREAVADRWQRATAIPSTNAASNGVHVPAPPR
jgi:hypothetical protein